MRDWRAKRVVRFVDLGDAVDAVDGFFLELLVEVGDLLEDEKRDAYWHDGDDEECQ